MDPQNTHEKNFRPMNNQRVKIRSHEIPMRIILDHQNSHEKTFWTHEDTVARWRETHRIWNTLRKTGLAPLKTLTNTKF